MIGAAMAAVVPEDNYPVRWAGRQAVVAPSEHIGQANAGQVSQELLPVINRGADALTVDGAPGAPDGVGGPAITPELLRGLLDTLSRAELSLRAWTAVRNFFSSRDGEAAGV